MTDQHDTTDALEDLLFEILREKIYNPIKIEPDESKMPGSRSHKMDDARPQTEKLSR